MRKSITLLIVALIIGVLILQIVSAQLRNLVLEEQERTKQIRVDLSKKVDKYLELLDLLSTPAEYSKLTPQLLNSMIKELNEEIIDLSKKYTEQLNFDKDLYPKYVSRYSYTALSINDKRNSFIWLKARTEQKLNELQQKQQFQKKSKQLPPLQEITRKETKKLNLKTFAGDRPTPWAKKIVVAEKPKRVEKEIRKIAKKTSISKRPTKITAKQKIAEPQKKVSSSKKARLDKLKKFKQALGDKALTKGQVQELKVLESKLEVKPEGGAVKEPVAKTQKKKTAYEKRKQKIVAAKELIKKQKQIKKKKSHLSN